jgi:hypothetical protein
VFVVFCSTIPDSQFLSQVGEADILTQNETVAVVIPDAILVGKFAGCNFCWLSKLQVSGITKAVMHDGGSQLTFLAAGKL